VMTTARLHATNYCQGCGRFMPAVESEKALGNPYGRCFRAIETDENGDTWDVWKIIPVNATVSRCFYFLNPEL